jgi:toxin ParE1/3/4
VAQLRVTVEAQADLGKIARFTQKEWGVAQRNIYLEQLEQSFSRITSHPSIGQACDHVRQGYRYSRVGQHLVFYRIAHDNTVEVIRVLHKSMFIEATLSQADGK